MEFGSLYSIMIGLFVMGIVLVSLMRGQLNTKSFIAHGMAATGSLSAVLCAIFVFMHGTQTLSVPIGPPYQSLAVRVDGLAAFFLAVIGVVGMAACVYAIGYGREYYNRRFSVMTALFIAFLLSMILVVTVSHVVAFLIAWEIMTVVSFLLVAHEYDKPANTRAAFIYFVMTHVGTAFILIAFLLLAKVSGSLDFAGLSALQADSWTRNAIFLCALIGFGTKAGMIPLHIWLPEAHPAAPSHVSAVMSGVMIKTAIYGMCRFYLEFLGAGPLWWGMAVLFFAALSSVLGVLYALMEHDIKKLLAYHSIENIGIILLGMGAGMVFMSKGLTMLAGMAWAAALFHVLNHAIFKSLLFMGAGAVDQATHMRDIEHLGGLIKWMPYTAALFLAGSVAISALPPLNGFVSEWLTFQSLFILQEALPGISGKVLGAAMVSILGITGALAAACFVKAFGMIFLAKPRSAHVEGVKEAPLVMLLPMGLLAVLCLILGVFLQGVLKGLAKILDVYSDVDAGALLTDEWYLAGFRSIATAGEFSPLLLMGLVAIGLVLAMLAYRLCGKPQVVHGETWTCGIIPTARMEYTATGFSGPIRRAFGVILKPWREILVEERGNQYFGSRMELRHHITYVFTEKFYRPFNRKVVKLSRFMKKIQTGSVQLYVGYIMAVTIVVLMWSTRW